MKARFLIVAFVCLVAGAPLALSQYSVTILNYIGVYSIATLGLVLLTGVGGLTSFGQAAFAGLGAYCTAWLTTTYGMSPWLTLPIGLALTVGVALILGLITLRLPGHYLPLATIAWSMSLYFMFGNLPWLGGHTGMGGLPAVTIGNMAFKDNRTIYYLIWVAVLLSLLLANNLLDSRLGRAMRALKGGTDIAEAMGVDTQRIKLVTFLIAAGLACLSGWLYAHMERFINPTPFGLPNGIEYLFMAVIGGAGYIWGAVLGATIVTLLKQKLQDVLPSLSGSQGNLDGIAFGLIIVLVLQRAKDGLWPWIARWVPHEPRRIDGDSASLPQRARRRPGGPLLQVVSASKRFGGLLAVRDVDLQVSMGEILGLLGPNGAGKSTTFNLVSGSLQLTSGSVVFDGSRIDGLRPHQIARRGISRTFQHVRLLQEMSVLDNVALGAHLRSSHGVLRSVLHAERRLESMLLGEAARQIRRVGLGPHIHDHSAGSLSLGQQRLLEIARALASDPLLLLLDEPAAGLRMQEKQALADLLRTLRADGLAILLVEHDMDFVMNLVDRAVVMSFGEKIAEGTPTEVQRNEMVVEAYLGSAA